MGRSFGRAVIIGLGGTGQLTLLRIKKMFRDYYGQLPPCIKLLAFDTTINRASLEDIREPLTLADDEFCHLSVESVGEAIKDPCISKWWIPYDPINNLSVTTGTGGIREVGRLATFKNIDTIEALLKRSFNQIWDVRLQNDMREMGMDLLQTTPQVFVVCSFAGGTGSGSFIDFSVLCRAVGSEKNMFYTAFFVMPWIYRDIAKTAFENGYAALTELESLNSCSAANPYAVSYTASLSASLTERPYHIVNLVDGESRNGSRILSYKQLPMFIGDCIFNSVGAAAGKRQDVVDNVMTMVNLAQRKDWRGQQALYSTFGTSAIVYPAAAIHEMYATLYAIVLLDHSLAFIGKSEDARKSLESTVRPFLADHALTTLKDKIAKPDVRPFVAGRKEKLTDPNLKASIVQKKQAWERSQRENWHMDQAATKLQSIVSQGVEDLLQKIKDSEATKQCPEGTHRAANRVLHKYWRDAQETLGEEQQQLTERRSRLDAEVSSLADEIQKRIPSTRKFWFADTAPVLNACITYANSCTELLQCELECERTSRIRALCSKWEQEANERERSWGRVTDRIEFTKQSFQAQRVRLASELSRFSVEELLKKRALFEIYVGLERRTDAAQRNVADVYSIPESVDVPRSWRQVREGLGIEILDETDEGDGHKFGDRIFEEFKRENNLRDRNAFLSLSRERLETIFMEYARAKLAAIAEWSVLDLLMHMEQRNPGTIKERMEEALRYSSQLLPINENELVGRRKILTEFTVIGGHYPDGVRLEDVIGPHIPTPLPSVQNIWVNTGDRQRITVTSYFSVIPLYVLRGIKEARTAYLDRVRPPAHVDRNFEFQLLDILPTSESEIDVLKLMSLSMLKCTGPIIQRLEQPDDGQSYQREGHYYYRLNPDIFGEFEDLHLPGQPGKFYSLYTELCQDFNVDYRKKLKQALQAKDTPDVKRAFLAEVKAKYDEFQEILTSKTFNKMITGNLYRQQVTFFHIILKNEFGLGGALEYTGP